MEGIYRGPDDIDKINVFIPHIAHNLLKLNTVHA